jgi:type 1 glutamine amidotransferase
MDGDVFGGSYAGHGKGEMVEVRFHERHRRHPILDGVRPWTRRGKLYRNSKNRDDAILLLTGTGLASRKTEPVAWARVYDSKRNARAFYTSMGFPHDFQNDNFRRMLANAIHWTAHRSVRRTPSGAGKGKG